MKLIKKKLFYIKKKKNISKKEKTPEQIEKEIEKAKLREEEKQKKQEIREKEKEENALAKHEKKVAKEIAKQAKKARSLANKMNKKAEKAKKSLKSKKNLSPLEKDELENTIKEADTINEDASKKENQAQESLDKANEINQKIEKRKLEKKNKREEAKKVREKKAIEKEYKKAEAKKKLEKKIIEKNMAIEKDIFELVDDYMLATCNDEGVEATMDSLKIYPSPLPFQRHINSLDMTRPYQGLLPALLKGQKTEGNSFIKLFHGPPGTGKTYRLLLELTKIYKDKNFGKILVCATSNIATVNLYTRAKNQGIHGSLVISNEKYYKASKKEKESWKPKEDNIIFTTVSMRSGLLLRDLKFKTILMDEASQCQEGWFWGLLREEVRYIYLSGDPKQLPALVSEDGNKLNHSRSLMERLMDMDYNSELLDTQRRMHPTICEFSNINFYDGLLKTDYKSLKNNNIAPIEAINVDGKETRIGTSFKNENEVNKLNELYNEFKKKFKQVIVISPYQAQCQLISQINPEIEIHTVDSFQGREADVVLITTVRSGDSVGFWSDERRLNVAMTRAKHVLRIIGNVETWKSGKSPLEKLANFLEKKNLINYSNNIKQNNEIDELVV